MKTLKTRYTSFSDLLHFSSGFGWDRETKKFTATHEVWEEYFEGRSNVKHLHDDLFEDFEDSHIVLGKNIASGKSSVGLGDTTDARTYGGKNHEWEYYSTYISPMMDDDEKVGKLHGEVVRKNSKEKLPIRKKARIDPYHVEKISDEISVVTGMNNHMFKMIQQRWQQEAEEKQVEKKNNNVWSAIKENLHLEKNSCFDALNLIHQMGMKATFVSMTIEEHLGWINRSVRKP